MWVIAMSAAGQTVSTGALSGTLLDPAGAVLPGAKIQLTDVTTATSESTISDGAGSFRFVLLPPGSYQIEAHATKYGLSGRATVDIPVTETVHLDLHVHVTINQRVDVVSETAMVQTESAALGRLVDQNAVVGLPLVNRNFTQIVGLSPGVVTGVNNAGELGPEAAASHRSTNPMMESLSMAPVPTTTTSRWMALA